MLRNLPQPVFDGDYSCAEADNKLPANWKAVLRVQLRNLVKSGKLVKPAGKNTYKLGESLKKAPKKKAVRILGCQPVDVHLATKWLLGGFCFTSLPCKG